MSDGVKRVEAFCAKAGMEDDSPLRLALLTVMESAETAREAVSGGARGLTPEGEAELIRRVTRAAAATTEREAARFVSRFDFAMGMKLAAAGLLLLGCGYGIGRWDGARQGAHAMEGAAFLGTLAELNDLRTLRQECQRTARRQSGGIACDLPPVWVRRERK